MAAPQWTIYTTQTFVKNNADADVTSRGNQETWIDLGKYESFVMGKHVAQETEEWLEKWTEYWKRIGVDGSLQRGKIKTTTALSLLRLKNVFCRE